MVTRERLCAKTKDRGLVCSSLVVKGERSAKRRKADLMSANCEYPNRSSETVIRKRMGYSARLPHSGFSPSVVMMVNNIVTMRKKSIFIPLVCHKARRVSTNFDSWFNYGI